MQLEMHENLTDSIETIRNVDRKELFNEQKQEYFFMWTGQLLNF